MKILFVVGGSYKAFYLNNVNRYKKLDLIVFQDNILYEYDYYNETFGNKIITKEMMSLQKKFKCKIIAKIKTNLFNIKNNEILYCDKSGVKIIKNNNYIKLFIKNKQFLIANKIINIKSDYFIYFSKNKNEFKINNSFNKNKIFVCDKSGVSFYYKTFAIRKFQKTCYFTLKI